MGNFYLRIVSNLNEFLSLYTHKNVVTMKNTLVQYLLLILLASCNTTSAIMQSVLLSDDLSEEEVVRGLKAALNIGTDKAVQMVSDPDGYFRDQAVKILLPPEMNEAIRTLRDAPGGEQVYQSTIAPVVDDLIKALNRSASDAASTALPIFKNAVTGITIQDGWSILKGDYQNAGDRSATRYFQDKTQEDLSNLFQPEIDTSLDKPLVGNTSANTIWNKFIKAHNAVVKSPANLLMRLEPVEEPNLSAYVTKKALDGLFLKIADEEKEIRDDPYKYANSLIEKVFGSNSL
jgi:hypothetical protein